MMGDFKGIVEEGSINKVVEPFGFGKKKNTRGKMLINFCRYYNLAVMNTLFKKKKMKLYTWKSPGD